MIIVGMMVMFTIFILGELIYIRYFEKREILIRKEGKTMQKSNERYYHPGHTWVELNQVEQTVEVGMDKFTQKIVGQVEEIELPRIGQVIQQGSPLWTLIRAHRRLTQVAPISGKVVDVKTMDKSTNSWLIKLRPFELSFNLNNLFEGEIADKWLDWSKTLFIQKFENRLGPVYQDGGELKEGIIDELTDDQWSRVQKEFFYPQYLKSSVGKE